MHACWHARVTSCTYVYWHGVCIKINVAPDSESACTLSSQGTHSKALRAVAERIVQETRSQVLSGLDHFEEATRDLDKFAIGTPQGAEVLAWLVENNLSQLGSVFAAEGVDSLYIIANMSQDDIQYFLAGGKFKSLTMRRSAVIEFSEAIPR